MSQTTASVPNINPPPSTPTLSVLYHPLLLTALPWSVQSPIDRVYPTTAECAPAARYPLLSRTTTLSSTTARVWALFPHPTSTHSYLRRTPSLTVRGLFVESMRSLGMILAKSINATLVQEVHAFYPLPNFYADLYYLAFARAYNLKTHMATHDPNRLKPHVCPHTSCGRSFSRKHDLGRHLVSIHRDESLASSHHSGSTRKSIGVEQAHRAWCDSCGKGWIGNARDCECNDVK